MALGGGFARSEGWRVCCRAALLKLEEDYIERQCAEIAKHKPDLVVTEKGLSDLAMHFLTKAGVSAIRRLRKTDNNRIARATGATIVHRCARAPRPAWMPRLPTEQAMALASSFCLGMPDAALLRFALPQAHCCCQIYREQHQQDERE